MSLEGFFVFLAVKKLVVEKEMKPILVLLPIGQASVLA
jgi:hypothetical protein